MLQDALNCVFLPSFGKDEATDSMPIKTIKLQIKEVEDQDV